MGILYYGDNLEILRNKIADESVDLCYIDPPFNSKRNYFQIYNGIGGEQDKAQAQAFIDTWQWDTHSMEGYQQIISNFEGRFTRQSIELIKGLELILGKSDLLAYLVSMTLRVTEIFRVLKPTGSFYLHCDPTASHYLKLILDAVFCSQGGDFRNEIIWHYGGWTHSKMRHFPRKHDTIFYYAKSPDTKYIPQSIEWTRDEYVTLRKQAIRKDENGREYIFDKRGNAGQKRYLDVALQEGRPVDSVWDIRPLSSSSAERMGYPTQKPEILLERIIQASSNEDDVVLDAYCGCGTTIAVSERLKRNWIGIDITYHSISLILKRMDESFGESIVKSIKVDGIPQDVNAAKALANRQDDRVRKEFEKWAVLTYTNNRGVINTKKGADKGIDGIVYFATGANATERMIIQVKSGGVNRSVIATLHGDMQREQAQMATLITLDEPTKPMKDEALQAGLYRHPLMGKDYERIQIVTIRELIEQEKRLELPLSFEVLKTAKKQIDDSQLQMGL
jgi:site-specific DNA-methyltransferase (adenine-specific)